jgi:FAD/FMN-containing dehydrogenase
MNTLTQHLGEILGVDNVQDDPAIIEAYTGDLSFTLPVKPRCAVKPQNTEQVQKIVQWANQTHTALVPISSGPPHFRGDTVPGVENSIMVDLSGMKRIIRIDRRNRMMIIEPGITFGQIQPELAKAGLRLASPLLPRSNKSVITALLEREPIIIPRLQWAFLDPLRCLQVVWGDGVKMNTGDAESLGTLEQEWEMGYAQMMATGPQQTDFYKLVAAAQGSMGIVTWASVRCEVLPEAHRLFFIPSDKLEDLIELLYKILKFRFGDELFILNRWSLASILENSTDRIDALARKLPGWALLVGISGGVVLAQEKVEYQQRDIAEMAQQAGLKLQSMICGIEGNRLLNIILDPSREPYWKLAYKGGCQDIFFLSTLEKAPDFVKAMYAVAESQDYPCAEIGTYIQPVHQGASCHIEFNLPYDPQHSPGVNRLKELYIKASEKLLERGAYYSRPYGVWSDIAYEKDPQSAAVLQKLKGIFDPHHILNPGKLCFK